MSGCKFEVAFGYDIPNLLMSFPLSHKITSLVGTVAPDFTLTDPASGTGVHLGDFAGRDVLLVFLRGTWCPFCRQQLQTLSESFEQLHQANIAVIGVVCQSVRPVQGYLEANPLPFPLLVDVKRTVAKAYGTYYWLAWDGINLARPSLFILDTERVVTFQHVGRSMRDLPLELVLSRFIKFLNPNSG